MTIMDYEREITHLRNNIKTQAEEVHDLDKRVSYLEKHNGFMLTTLQSQVEKISSDILEIKNFLSNREGYKTAIKTVGTALVAFLSVLTAMGIHDHIFRLFGLK